MGGKWKVHFWNAFIRIRVKTCRKICFPEPILFWYIKMPVSFQWSFCYLNAFFLCMFIWKENNWERESILIICHSTVGRNIVASSEKIQFSKFLSDVNLMELMSSAVIKWCQPRGFPSVFSYYNMRSIYLSIHMDNNDHLDPRGSDWNQVTWN